MDETNNSNIDINLIRSKSDINPIFFGIFSSEIFSAIRAWICSLFRKVLSYNALWDTVWSWWKQDALKVHHLTYSFFYSFRRAALAKYKCHSYIILSILPCVYNCLYFLIIIKGFIYFDWSCGAVWHSVWHCTRICRISKLGSVLSGTPDCLQQERCRHHPYLD